MIDVHTVMYNLLATSGTGLYTLCGTRLYVPHVPTSFVNSQAALEFSRRSGSSQREHELLYPSIQFKCYGGSANFSDAEAVYRALCDVLRNLNNRSITGGVILQTQEEVMGQSLIDPDQGWPFVLSFWRLIMRPTT